MSDCENQGKESNRWIKTLSSFVLQEAQPRYKYVSHIIYVDESNGELCKYSLYINK